MGCKLWILRWTPRRTVPGACCPGSPTLGATEVGPGRATCRRGKSTVWHRGVPRQSWTQGCCGCTQSEGGWARTHSGAVLQRCGVESGSGARFPNLASNSAAAPTLLALQVTAPLQEAQRGPPRLHPQDSPRVRVTVQPGAPDDWVWGPQSAPRGVPLAGSQAAREGAPGRHQEPGPQEELVAMSSRPWMPAQPTDGLEPCSRLQGGRQDSRSSCESSSGNSLLCPMSPRWTVPPPPSHSQAGSATRLGASNAALTSLPTMS